MRPTAATVLHETSQEVNLEGPSTQIRRLQVPNVEYCNLTDFFFVLIWGTGLVERIITIPLA